MISSEKSNFLIFTSFMRFMAPIYCESVKFRTVLVGLQFLIGVDFLFFFFLHTDMANKEYSVEFVLPIS